MLVGRTVNAIPALRNSSWRRGEAEASTSIEFSLKLDLAAPRNSSHGVNQFCRVVSDAVLEYDFSILDVFDFLRGIALDDNQVGSFARSDGSNAIGVAQKLCPVGGCDVNRFEGGEPCLDQQLDFTLVAESGKNASDACWIFAGKQGPAGFHA